MNGPMNGTKRTALDRPRARRDAAKVLAVALQSRYRKLLESSDQGEDAVVVATADLAQCMYENVEFVIWALKSIGGMNPPPPDQLNKVSSFAAPPPANDPRFAKPPPVVIEAPVKDECTCPPLEAGLLFREKHMTSCPKYVP